MSAFDLVVFDWDGTLMDSTAAIVRAMQRAAEDLGVPPPPAQRARQVIGLGLADALRLALPELPAQRYPEMAARYRHHYLSHDGELELFPGVEELLARLVAAGRYVAVATEKSRLGLERALDHSGLRRYVMASRTADECHSKPHPQMLHELLEEFAVPPERAVMIGDTTHDLLMAQAAGTSAIGVAYGAHPREALTALRPLSVVDSARALAPLLLGEKAEDGRALAERR